MTGPTPYGVLCAVLAAVEASAGTAPPGSDADDVADVACDSLAEQDWSVEVRARADAIAFAYAHLIETLRMGA